MGFSLVVPSVVQAYGLDTRLVWVPVLFYAFWTLIITFYKPKRVFSDYPERSVIERIRGWLYVFSLAITFTLNFVFLTLIPKTFIIVLIGSAVVAFLLALVVKVVPKSLFRRELRSMNKYQEFKLLLVLKESGIASIRLSISILLLNSEFIASNEFLVVNAIVTLIISVPFFVLGFSKEKASSRLASDLAVELKNSNWYKKYSYHQRQNKRN